MSSTQIDVIVPVFNEQDVLESFYRRLTALELNLHPIFIDNASTDNSLALLQSFQGVEIIRHASNEGYGASLRDGIRAATAEKIIIIDADCEYPPEAIPELVRQLDNHDIVYTSRFLDDRNKGMGLLKKSGNIIISRMFNLLFHQQVTDLYTGSKGFKRAVLAGLPMERDGFEHVLEIAARLARNGMKIHEIPVDFKARRTGSSKMSHVSETLKYLYLLFYYHLTLPGNGTS